MRMRFIGAINQITGSCTLFEYHHPKRQVQFLVDCGMDQESGPANSAEFCFPFEPSDLDFVLLTHAHIDHCGLIPRLYRDGFVGKVICTGATADLAKVALADSAGYTDLYEQRHVDQMEFERIDERPGFGWSRLQPIGPCRDLGARFLRSSHILGSTSIDLQWLDEGNKARRIVMSGDLGNNTKANPYQPLLGHRHDPFDYPDYMVVESTYGDRERDPRFQCREKRLDAWFNLIRENNQSGARILVPAFALQRSQELLIDIYSVLKRHGHELTIPVDVIYCSRLGQRHTEVFRRHLNRRQNRDQSDYLHRSKELTLQLGLSDPAEVDQEIGRILSGTNQTVSADINCQHRIVYDTSIVEPNDARLQIVIASSGMASAGPIQEYLLRDLHNEQTRIVLTGYAPQSTPAGLLRGLMSARKDGKEPSWRVVINERRFESSEIKAEVQDFGGFYSGHADVNGLMSFVFDVPASNSAPKPVTVFLNHGSNEQRGYLKDALMTHKSRQHQRTLKDVLVPTRTDQWFDLNRGEWVEADASEAALAHLLAEQRKTNALLQEIRDHLSALVASVTEAEVITSERERRHHPAPECVPGPDLDSGKDTSRHQSMQTNETPCEPQEQTDRLELKDTEGIDRVRQSFLRPGRSREVAVDVKK